MSNFATFKTFIEGLSKEAGFALDPSSGLLGVNLNNVPFIIAYDPDQWGAENVMFSCDFGEAPQENRCAILEKLLMVNREMHGLWSPIFTMHAETGHIMSMMALPLEGLDPANTMDTMLKHVAVVQSWKETHFLEAEPA